MQVMNIETLVDNLNMRSILLHWHRYLMHMHYIRHCQVLHKYQLDITRVIA
jgi:hypothetical protein